MRKSLNRIIYKINIKSKYFFSLKKFSLFGFLAKKNFGTIMKYCNKQLIMILILQKKKNHVKISNKFKHK